ncbi:MAG: LytTR family transcriptional regulator DNA-binding domain-containing protein [Saccharofermentans sp.]|nr:LytTR family transcriptional regulator DNA-binding domain-containing protein [Saccharofermentans sp.]
MRVAVLDKDTRRANRIVDLMQSCVVGTDCEICSTAFALVSYVYDEMKGEVDLLIVHVDYDDFSSIQVANDIQNYFPIIKVVFYSESTECAEAIFEANPYCFLKIPLKNDLLARVLNKINKSLESEHKQVLEIVSQRMHYKILFSSIRYIESDGRNLAIYSDENVYDVNMTMSEMIEKLPDQFVQCHRSYIVNKERIQDYSKGFIRLFTHELIPVSRKYTQTIKEVVKL